MKTDIRMPQLGEAAAEAKIVSWLVQPGTTVKAEQELVEVQTEKSILTVAAPVDGILSEVCVQAGEIIKVGALLGMVSDGGSVDDAAVVVTGAGLPANVHDISAPTSMQRKRDLPESLRGASEGPSRLAPSMMLGGVGERAFLSPRVREMVAESGLKASDLAFINGTGTGGRITATDIERYLAMGEPMPAIRQAVAGAMTRSWTRPLATVATTVRIDTLLTHRRTVVGRPSLTVYGLRALAVALRQGSPFAKRLYGNRVHQPGTIDLAVAVEVGDGVLTPVVRRVDELTLPALTSEVEAIIEKARAGKIAEAGEAVGTVSNYGVFGITWATPIPLPGHSVILGLGAPQNHPEWNPATKTWDRVRAIEATLTFDHRISDGGDAARLLNRIAELLAKPERL